MNDDETIEEESEEDEDSKVLFTHIPGVRRAGRPVGSINIDDPIVNAETLPCFPNAAKREGRLAVSMRVTKVDPPFEGHKGTIPASSDLDYIGRQFGDGVYNLELLNQKKQPIKVREGVCINIGILPGDAAANNKGKINDNYNGPSSELGTLLKTLIEKLDRDRGRDDAQTASLINQARELAKQHADMVVQSSKDSSLREHDHHRQQMASQEQMFKVILAQVTENAKLTQEQLSNAHQRQIEWQDQSFKQMFMMITESNKHEKAMLREQLRFAQDNEGVAEEAPWMKALETGISGIKELRLLASKATDINEKKNLLKKVNELQKTRISPTSTTENRGKTNIPPQHGPRVMSRTKRPESESEPDNKSDPDDSLG